MTSDKLRNHGDSSSPFLINIERIHTFLQEELYPQTPQQISAYLTIPLSEVYEILQSNPVMFIQVLKDDNALKGWIISF